MKIGRRGIKKKSIKEDNPLKEDPIVGLIVRKSISFLIESREEEREGNREKNEKLEQEEKEERDGLEF